MHECFFCLCGGYKIKKRIVVIKSLADYISKVQTIKEEENPSHFDLLFRGQSSDDELLPSVQRYVAKMSNCTKCEKLIFEEFKRNLPLSQNPYNLYNDWQMLSLAQHYGLPTRFLDWSYSALAALWFSVQNPDRNKSFVYVLITKDIDLWNAWKRFCLPFCVDRILIYRPDAVVERVSSQSSVFTVHPFGMKIEGDEKFTIKKLEIENPKEIKKQLDDCGVNEYSIYPDLPALCNYLKWRYFK